MANDPTITPASPAAELFQKAHGRIILLQRLDEQIAQLLEQRRKIQQELAGLQGQINEEFSRVMSAAKELPGKLLTQLAQQGLGMDTAESTENARPKKHAEPLPPRSANAA